MVQIISKHRKRLLFFLNRKFLINYFGFLKVKFEPISADTGSEANQDILIRHLQHRISDLQDDNLRLQSKSAY